jgi:hypothetical protein
MLLRQLIFLLLLTSFLNNSCVNAGKEDIRIPDSSFKILNYQYTRDSSIKRKHTKSWLNEFGKLIKLHPMEEFNNSNCIRLWVWNWEKDSNYVVDIHYGGLKKISFVQFGSHVKDSVEFIRVHHRNKSVVPKLSWDSLFLAVKMNRITALNVGRQPTGLTHMTPVQFEITESGNYHFYQYYEPAYFRKVDSNANKIYSFLTHLNRQIGGNIYIADSAFAAERE